MSGELKPNSHQNIKMTLVSSRYPTHFEGEIQCQIEWENEGDDKKHHDAKSMQTTTVVNDIGEFLFIRLKKRSKIVRKIAFVTLTSYSLRPLSLLRTKRLIHLLRTFSLRLCTRS
jgi:predicted peptidase